MGKERMTFQRFNNGNYPIMTAHPQVIPLGDVMGEDDPGALANTREHR
jgi:hypothetical protein